MAADGPAITETNKAEASLKRFWKTVGIAEKDGVYAVTLDQRALKTPAGNRLLLPKEKKLVAALVATEWDNQETLLKPHALPMVRTLSRWCQCLLMTKSMTLDVSGFQSY